MSVEKAGDYPPLKLLLNMKRGGRVDENSNIFLIIVILSIPGVYAGAGDLVRSDGGTVTDNTTGLIWQQMDDNKRYVWEAASNYCGDLSLAGFNI